MLKGLIGYRQAAISLCAIFCSLFFAANATAQSFTQKLQSESAGKGKVTLHHEATIDALVNGSTRTVTEQVKKAAPKKSEEIMKTATLKTAAKSTISEAKATVDKAAKTVTATEEAMAAAGTTAYCVQVFSGKDKQKAEVAKNLLKSKYPNYMVHVMWHRPRFTTRVGYFSKKSTARRVLNEVKQIGYPNATLIPVMVDNTLRELDAD